MRIMIVTEEFLPASDGLVLRLTEAIRFFLKEGHQVVVITPDRGIDQFEDATIYGIPDKHLPLGKKLFWAPALTRINDIMMDFSPHVVHIVNPLILGTVASQYAVKLEIPTVVSYHTNYLSSLKRLHLNNRVSEKMVWKARQKVSANASLNLCTSHVMRHALEKYGIRGAHVLKRGVDSEKRSPRFASEDMRLILNKGQRDKKLLVYVGSLLKRKELESLLPLLRRRDDVCLAIVGDGEYRSELERAFAGTNCVFTGYLRGRNLAEAYASGDAFIFPTLDEQVGLTLLEAMASGVPIIAAQSPLTTEQFHDGQDALLYTAGDEDSLDAAIARLDDQALVRRIRVIARKEAEASSWERASQQLMDYYNIAYTRATHYN